ncbi:MAG TPA: phytanoyl-CoA dioxygenase family protein [Steroidobacteraceae bacterium]|nr:phytanoyl-CoA dioxygenase family protein [Steroidobacteraceae bacterium]
MTDQGFAVHAAVFGREEMRAISDSIAAAKLRRSRAGTRHILGCEAVARIANDHRMIEIASRWLGAAAIPFKATLFDKSPGANWLVAWHQDTALPMESRREADGWGPWSEKYGVTYAHAPARALANIVAVRVHLDNSAADNGPLRVLPGTQAQGVLSDAQVSELAKRIAAVDCHVEAGGIVVMRPLIIHASSKIAAPVPRRVVHFEYAASLTPEPGLHLRVA